MPQRSVYLETFGCQMNELDSELVTGRLRALGYSFTSESGQADVVLYNTCSVREHAEQKVWSRLGELQIRKQTDPGLVVGVLGCMAERDGADLIKRMPVVDVLCGPGELDKLPGLLDNAVRTRQSLLADPPAPRSYDDAYTAATTSARQVALQGDSSRRSSTLAAAEDSLEMLDLSRAISPIDAVESAKRSAYVRITRGCNKFCTYCVVPFTRGAEVHRPPEHIIDECKRLTDAGIIEITLLGQTVNHYRFELGAAITINGQMQPQKGRSYSGGHRRDPFTSSTVTTFADLLRRIHDEIPAIQRLRFVTSYPRDFGDDVLEVIRDHPRICRYLHVPAQSGSDRVLKLMNRGYSVSEYLEFLDRARAHLHQPDMGRPLMLSGDFIVGFPTETEEDFEASVALARRARYKNSFIFKYSPRPGTLAFDKIADDVPESVKRSRNNRLLAVQNEISEQVMREQVGLTVDAFVEGLSPRERKRQAQPTIARGSVALTINGSSTSEEADCGSACAASTFTMNDGDVTPSAVQLVARTDGDLIVLFDVPDQTDPQTFTGKVVRLLVFGALPLALQARLVTN
jgi:tRNA-2-methylthio-N6-dimethylallyladenosine synthase